MNFLKVVHDDLNPTEIANMIKSPQCGAISLFIGTTRDNFEGLKVKSLKYDAYESMALKEMEKICSEMRQKWSSLVNIAIYHRLGDVAVTEESVIIAVSSPHRLESLEAVSFAINSLKTSVPIWKKEEYYDSPAIWKENKECTWNKPTGNENL